MKEPRRDTSIVTESEFRAFKARSFPMDLSAGRYLTRPLTALQVAKMRKFPESAKNARDYLRKFDRLNNLRPAKVTWVRCTHTLESVTVSQPQQQAA